MQIKILVVDDSATDRLIIKSMLSEYLVLNACNGVEAMSVLEEHDGINLVVLDLNMPEMNGFQVLEALNGDQRFSKVRTIILTNYDELENEIRGLKLGAVDYIRKPIHMESLKARIEVHAALLRAQHALEQQLDEKTISFDMIFDQAPIGIAISHSCGTDNSEEAIVRINSVYERITGRTKEELIDTGWSKITHPDDIEEDMKNLRRLQSGEIKTYSMDKRYVRPDGSIVWVHMVVAPLALSNEQQYRHICLVQDITGRKEIEKALNESERSKSVLLSNLPGLAYRCSYDQSWTMQYVSEGCYALTGYPPESLLYNRDLSFNDIISPEYRDDLWNEWHHIIVHRKPFKYEYEIITAAGERKWVLEMGQVIYNDDGGVEALEGIILDISDRKAIENTLKYNNEHDRWTGLHNRDYLVSFLKKDAVHKENVKKALIGINLSTVQLVTANYGFQYTQNLLKKAAEALAQYCTDKRMLFHTYHNRFVFYVADYKNRNELIEFGRTIADMLESLFFMDRISGGIGILEIEQNSDEADAELLLRRLLIASERSVSLFDRDFDFCFYDEELEALVNRERDIVEALSQIAADDHGNDDLFLQYQPIMDVKTSSIIGFEALARLRTKELGQVSPLEFIPIAEKTKLILPIGEKVIVKAFRFSNRLRECGYEDIGVSINISAIQLLKPDFTDRLFEFMRDMQIEPKKIGFEVTESIFVSDFEYINSIIEKMREVGFHIAIDDFGTGYSSLAREKELKVDCMKIDKQFIDRLLGTDLGKEITSDIISMSHKLGHCTIAEGVEHESQLQYLKEHNCDRIQGYLISKPLDEEDAIHFLKEYDAGRGI
ncbi:MAG: EAL domain-containing protein [Clostridiaceae bacterium]|nr:EAL domain-containing protein [Clostridiaceae bacterium]